MENLHLFDIIYQYCRTQKCSLVHFKISYKNEQEKQDILNFYENKINIDYFQALKNENEGFFAYKDMVLSELDAETSFPTKSELIEEYGEDCIYHVHCFLYNQDGILLWENM